MLVVSKQKFLFRHNEETFIINNSLEFQEVPDSLKKDKLFIKGVEAGLIKYSDSGIQAPTTPKKEVKEVVEKKEKEKKEE